MATLFGSGIKRREDPRLITGTATYTDDVKLPGMLYAAFLHSTHAHARLKRVDTSHAKSATGVVAVYTGADVKDRVGAVPCAWTVPDCDLKLPPHPPLAVDRVRHVGDGIALVIAESRAEARDALDLIDVDYEPLDAVTDPEAATKPGAPQLHDEVPSNVAFTWKVAGGDADKAFAEAEATVEQRLVHPRLQATAIEPRAAVASFNGAMGQLTLWVTSQNPHIHRFLCSVVLSLPEHKVHVIAPEIGGAFGSKIPVYADEIPGQFRGDGHGSAGQVDRRSIGELQDHDARAGSRPVRFPVWKTRRHDYGSPNEGLRWSRRLRVDRSTRRPYNSPRAHVLRRIHDTEY